MQKDSHILLFYKMLKDAYYEGYFDYYYGRKNKCEDIHWLFAQEYYDGYEDSKLSDTSY